VTTEVQATRFPITIQNNRTFVEVPWDQVDALHARLLAAGILATACYDADSRTAGLEISEQVDAGKLQAALSA